MKLKEEIIGACLKCGRTGYVGQEICECMLKFRAYNRLVNHGFKQSLLDIVSDPTYAGPLYENGKFFVDYFLANLDEVESKGLSLYIFSRERGRGKTTLAHALCYQLALSFAHTAKYRRESSLSFGFERSNELLRSFNTDPLYHSTYYVLDDLGNEDRSGWRKELGTSVLQEVLPYRRENKLSTIITSNYAPNDLSNFYSGMLDSLLEIGPDGTMGGLMYRQVELGGGTDLRMEGSVWPVED